MSQGDVPMQITNRPDEIENGSSAAQKLTGDQVRMIEEALESVGEFGEVRLVVEKGRLRFIVTQKSVDALKWAQQRAAGRS